MIPGKFIKITGVGKYVPRQVLSSEIENTYGLPQGWSEKYSGVLSRHHVSFETNGYMGARAIEQALLHAGIQLENIDLLIAAGATFDYPLPNQSSIIKNELKKSAGLHFPTIDIDSSCLSFISAFEIACSLLDGKKYKNIIIVSSEISSKGLDKDNWETLTLFGDGAAAVIVSYDETSDSRYIKGMEKTYVEGVYDSIVKGGGNAFFFKDHSYDPKLHSFSMNGKKLLRLAKKKIPEFINELFEDLPFAIEDVDVIIPHQASKAGMSLFSQMHNLNRIKGNLSTHGNCIAASIPMVLCDTILSGELKRNDICLLIGTAAGFSMGAALFRY